jgi:hypothetical protein
LDGSDGLNPISIVWDVQFTGESVTEKGTTDTILLAASDYIQNSIFEVMNHNELHRGQKVSRAGYTTGLRFIIDATFMGFDEISNINDRCLSFKHELAGLSSISIGESLPIPLDLRTKSHFPDMGRIMLCIGFTNGLGYDDAKSARAAMSNQTKDTKDGLDPTALGKGSSGKLFSEEFRSILSDPWWMRVFDPRGEISSGMLKKAADGGCYDLSFDLRGCIENLVEISEGKWWNKLDPDELTLSPKLIVDPTETIDSDYDPCNYYHLSLGDKAEDLVGKTVDQEMAQTGDADIAEELTYTLGRVLRGKRTRKQVGVDHGLAHGFEDFVISKHVIHPLVAEEFVNCLAFFLMTRKPKYWRNGQSRIIILQPFTSALIEDLKEVE